MFHSHWPSPRRAAGDSPAAAPEDAQTGNAEPDDPDKPATGDSAATQSAEELKAALFRAVQERTRRAEASVVRSMAEQNGISEQTLAALLSEARAAQAETLPPEAQARLDALSAGIRQRLVMAEVKSVGAELGLVDPDVALALLAADALSVTEDGTVTGVREALENLKRRNITRNLIREYYGIPSGDSTAYHYVNAGFVKCNEENSPKVDKTAFIGDVNTTCSVTGYENGWVYEAQYMKGDPVVDDLATIARGQKTGDDCARMLVSVDMAASVAGQTGVYEARRAAIAVEATPPSGDPKTITRLNGTFHQSGDLTPGTFNVQTKTFTAA